MRYVIGDANMPSTHRRGRRHVVYAVNRYHLTESIRYFANCARLNATILRTSSSGIGLSQCRCTEPLVHT